MNGIESSPTLGGSNNAGSSAATTAPSSAETAGVTVTEEAGEDDEEEEKVEDDEEEALFVTLEQQEEEELHRAVDQQPTDIHAAPRLLQKALEEGQVKADDSEEDTPKEVISQPVQGVPNPHDKASHPHVHHRVSAGAKSVPRVLSVSSLVPNGSNGNCGGAQEERALLKGSWRVLCVAVWEQKGMVDLSHCLTFSVSHLLCLSVCPC